MEWTCTGCNIFHTKTTRQDGIPLWQTSSRDPCYLVVSPLFPPSAWKWKQGKKNGKQEEPTVGSLKKSPITKVLKWKKYNNKKRKKSPKSKLVNGKMTKPKVAKKELGDLFTPPMKRLFQQPPKHQAFFLFFWWGGRGRMCCTQGSYRKILSKFINFSQNLAWWPQYGAEKQHKGMQLLCTSGKGAQPLL